MSRTLLAPTRAVLRLHLRGYATAPKPHARLEPASALVQGKDLEGVYAIVMDRPEARNALSVQMVDEMRAAIAKLAADPSARVVLLHSTGKVFCAGADLRERKTMSQPQVAKFLDALNAMVCELEDLPLPTVAVVPGPALGGGTELALGCDLRVGCGETAFTLPEAKLGIIPGAGGTQRMTKLVGMSRAMELIFTGRKVAADEAARIGESRKHTDCPAEA
jgi:methylglutaconyl-CoA hydratase